MGVLQLSWPVRALWHAITALALGWVALGAPSRDLAAAVPDDTAMALPFGDPIILDTF